MRLDAKLEKMLDKVLSGDRLPKEDCKYLLSIPETSFESSLLRGMAAKLVRGRNGNSAIILGQIGVDIAPCPGGCKFCNFGDGHTHIREERLSEEALREKISGFCEHGDLYGLYLMSMHDYDLRRFLEVVRLARAIAPAATQIWANVTMNGLQIFGKSIRPMKGKIYHLMLSLPRSRRGC